MDEKVPGGNKIALAEGESLHDESETEDGVYSATGKADRMSHRTASQSLPRFLDTDGTRVSGARKVDSLPVKILDESYTAMGDKKTRAKKMIRSFGSFMQKVARQITLYTSTSTRLKGTGKDSDTGDGDSDNSTGRSVSSNSPKSSGRRHIRLAAAETGEKPPGVIGIHNHGNTCFMNAVLQCLSNTDLLLSYFILDQYKEDIKRSNKHNAKKFGTRGELTEHLATLLKSLWTCKYTPEISSEFKATVAKYGCQYRGSSQHDAQEFLIWLLDKVHEDLNIATKKKYRANRSSYGRSDEDVAAEALANHARCNNSFIYDIFQALYRSSLTCPNCCHRSTTFDPFLSVSLPIPHKTSQAVYVTVVRDDRTLIPVRYGFLFEQEWLVSELRQAVSKETGIPLESLILIEIEANGSNRSLNDSFLFSELSDNVCLCALEARQSAADESQTPRTESGGCDDVVRVIVIKKLVAGSDVQRFGAPLLLQVTSRTSLAELKTKILESVKRFESETDSLNLVDVESFRLKFKETYLDDGDGDHAFPLSSENLKEAFSSFPSGSGPRHIRLLAEWETKATLPMHLKEIVEDHETVRQARSSVQQSSLGTLDECFQVYTQEEQLGPDNAWLCPSCRKYQQGTVKALTLWSLPEVLVIHLKRFKQDAVHRTKLNTLVMFPINGLDLRHHVQKATASSSSTLSRSVKSGAWTTWKPGRKTADCTEDYLYDLYAVCNHYGDMHGGHYTAFCKNLCDGRWYSYNDSKATEMREGEVVTRAAYLLFYQKRSSNFPRSVDWLNALQQIDYSVHRGVTSHSLDDLLDGDCETSTADIFPDDEFRRNIPVYTTRCPPARITRHTSTRNAKAHADATSSSSSSLTDASAKTSSADVLAVWSSEEKSQVSSDPPASAGVVVTNDTASNTTSSHGIVNGDMSNDVATDRTPTSMPHEVKEPCPVASHADTGKDNLTSTSGRCDVGSASVGAKSIDSNGTFL